MGCGYNEDSNEFVGADDVEVIEDDGASFADFLNSIFAIPAIPEDLIAHYTAAVADDDGFFTAPVEDVLPVLDRHDGLVREFQAAVREGIEFDGEYVAEQLAEALAFANVALRAYVNRAYSITV